MALDPAEIHYGIRGQRFGPVDLHTLVGRIRSGQLSGDDFVWDDDLDDWIPLRRYGVLLASLHEELPDEIAADDPRLRALAGDSAAAQSIEELDPAGFFHRLLAFLLDDLVLLIPMVLWTDLFYSLAGIEPLTWDMLLKASEAELQTIMDQLTLLTGGAFVIRGIYHALLESSPWQATLGKRALGLRVTDESGARISLPRAVVRHFARLLCQITFMIGYLMILVTARRQGLHDRVARTLVVRNNRR